MPYDPVKDFLPIAILCVSTTSIVVHPSVPVEDAARSSSPTPRPIPASCPTAPPAPAPCRNLSGELFKQLTGLTDLVHIPYKGAGPGITDLVSGHIPVMTPNITGQVLELHRTGKIRILAVNCGRAAQGGARDSHRHRARACRA